jgi:serine/threonine protein kinase
MPRPKNAESGPSEKKVLGDRYRVEKKLGSGNFGTAFLVTDLVDEVEQLKVLKEISISDMESDESIESVQEAQLLSKLDNPYILKYHESFLDEDFFCIVTEYCEVNL